MSKIHAVALAIAAVSLSCNPVWADDPVNPRDAKIAAGGMIQQSQAGRRAGLGIGVSAHQRITLGRVEEKGIAGGYGSVDLGGDARIEATSSMTDSGLASPELTRLDLRSPGASLIFWNINPPSNGPLKSANLKLELLGARFRHDEQKPLKKLVNAAEATFFDAKGRAIVDIDGLPIELCAAGSLKLLPGVNVIQGDEGNFAFEFAGSVCAGVRLGERLSLTNTTSATYFTAQGEDDRRQPAGAGKTASFSNTTQASVTLRPVKFSLAYTYSRDSSENHAQTRTNEIVAHQVAVGVAY